MNESFNSGTVTPQLFSCISAKSHGPSIGKTRISPVNIGIKAIKVSTATKIPQQIIGIGFTNTDLTLKIIAVTTSISLSCNKGIEITVTENNIVERIAPTIEPTPKNSNPS